MDIPNGGVIWEFFKFFGTSFTVILGWLVVSDQQESREMAKNRYSRIYILRDELRGIEVLARNFHTVKYDVAGARELMRMLKVFSGEMAHLKRCGCFGEGTLGDVAVFRKAITLRNFDSAVSYVVQSLDSELVLSIEAASAALDRQLLEVANVVASKPRRLRESLRHSLLRRI